MKTTINIIFLALLFITSSLIANDQLSHFTKEEQDIIQQAQTILNSKEMNIIREMQETNTSTTIHINNLSIQYEAPIFHRVPQLDTGIYHFTIGKTTFDNVNQFNSILLQELYRLKFNSFNNASDFAKRAEKQLKK